MSTLLVQGVVALTIAYFAASLLGQAWLEQSRREALRAREQARQARLEAAVLAEEIERLSNGTLVERWAKLRGFAPAEVPTSERGEELVATR